MDLLKATLNILNHCKTMLKMSGKMMWMKEVMKPLNMLKSVPVSHVAQFYLTKQAREKHAQKGRVRSERTRREKVNWIKLRHLADYDWLLEFLSS